MANDIIRPKWALVADEKLGFGRVGPDVGGAVGGTKPAPGRGPARGDASSQADSGLTAADSPQAPPAMRRVVFALREESRVGASDADLQQFLADAERLEARYKTMLTTLAKLGNRLVRYGTDNYAPLVAAFSGVGMKVLGPTVDHLRLCAQAIRQSNHDAASTAGDWIANDSAINEIELYRRMAVPAAVDAADMPGRGAALNNQSIVTVFEFGGSKVLLSGEKGHIIVELPDGAQDASSAMQQVRSALSAKTAGVVLLGGYDFGRSGR